MALGTLKIVLSLWQPKGIDSILGIDYAVLIDYIGVFDYLGVFNYLGVFDYLEVFDYLGVIDSTLVSITIRSITFKIAQNTCNYQLPI